MVHKIQYNGRDLLITFRNRRFNVEYDGVTSCYEDPFTCALNVENMVGPVPGLCESLTRDFMEKGKKQFDFI